MVEATFAKFKQGAVKNYEMQHTDEPNMNPVENGILELVAQLNPDIFIRLENYYKNHQNYLDKTISAFNREIQFYIAYLDFMVQIISALLENHIKIFYVTHLYEFARGFYTNKLQEAICLRAEREAGGELTFRIIEGEPLQTSYGQDLYDRIFGT